jgi:hypothetical protein
MANTLLKYQPNSYPSIPGGEANYLAGELRRIANAINRLVEVVEIDWTRATPTPTASSGSFTTVTCSIRQRLVGSTCTINVQINVTSVGTAAGEIVVPVSFPASFRTAGAALDDTDHTVNVNCRIAGSNISIMPTSGVIANHLYLASITYEL